MICISGIHILLRRLAYPNRLTDLTDIFRRPKSQLSMIINTLVYHLYEKYGHLLESLDHPWTSNESLQEFCNAIHEKGAPLTTCVGFIDGNKGIQKIRCLT